MLSSFTSNIRFNKTGVISDPLGQTHSPLDHSEYCFLLFCFSRFENTDGRTDGQHVRKQLSLPAVTLGWPSLKFKI